MAEFCKVMRQAARMCASHRKDCTGCGLVKDCMVCPFEGMPENWQVRACKLVSIEHIVMDWAAKNPEPRYPTWNEWYKATFPNSNYHTIPCPSMFYKICETSNYHGEMECYECKNRPIPADIAEKLGIKPIGGEEDA